MESYRYSINSDGILYIQTRKRTNTTNTTEKIKTNKQNNGLEEKAQWASHENRAKMRVLDRYSSNPETPRNYLKI